MNLYRWFGWLGFERRYDGNRLRGWPTGLRFRWLEMNWNRLGLALAVHLWGDEPHYSLDVHVLWLQIFLRLPGKPKREVPAGEMSLKWGFTIFGRAVHLCWDKRCKVVYFPWDWLWLGTWAKNCYGEWVPRAERWYFDWSKVIVFPLEGSGLSNGQHHFVMETPCPDGRWFGVFRYTYVLRSGEVQERLAAIWESRWEWRWRWFMWLPWPRLVRHDIEVEFNQEIGEEVGSWKGGCTGCSWDIKRGETPEQALRRMERERKFAR